MSGREARRLPEVRLARSPAEVEAVQRLLYRTFVEEIPQHPPNPERRLVDRFHEENTYFVCLRDGVLLGTITYRARRPFSLDLKLGSVDPFLPAGRRLCEIRLLAVEPEHRHTPVASRLLQALALHAIREGCDAALISGTTRQQKLYRHLGFEPFGPLVGSPGAQFQPMFLSLEAFKARARGPLAESLPVRVAPDPRPPSPGAGAFAGGAAGG
jgi:GNAT superfamily N-acetyltransferase